MGSLNIGWCEYVFIYVRMIGERDVIWLKGKTGAIGAGNRGFNEREGGKNKYVYGR